MSNLPKKYQYLLNEPSPKLLVEAVKLHGVYEFPGTADNPIIEGWGKELNLERVYTNDAIPWCGLFVGVCVRRAEQPLPVNPLWALNWTKYGDEVKEPMLGDILTFKRNGGGHVAIYVGEDATHYHILGGNQSDKVCIVRKSKKDLFAARRTKWKVSQPTNVRKIFLDADGPVSSKED